MIAMSVASDGRWPVNMVPAGLEDGVLVSNLQPQSSDEAKSGWDEPDALIDIVCVAGTVGLIAGLLAVLRLTGTHFPDSGFLRALPLLLLLPPASFLGTLAAPGGLLQRDPSTWSRAVWLALTGLTSYLVPLVVVSLAATLASHR